MTILFAFLVFLPKLILGLGVAQAIWSERQTSAWALKFFVTIPLGLGLSSALFFIWLVLGLPARAYLLAEIVLIVALFIYLYRTPALRPGWERPPAFSRFQLGLTTLTLLVAAVSGAFFFREALRLPHGYEDAWFIWNMAARFLYRAADWKLRFASQGALWHPDYPLLLPLNIFQGWLLTGETTRVPIALAALFTFSIPGLVFVTLARARTFAQGALPAILLLLTPWFVQYGTHQLADIPLAAYFLGAAALFLLYLVEQKARLLALAGLLAGLAAWTKNEGWLFWGNLFLFCLLFAWRNQRTKAYFAFLVGSLPPLAVAVFFKFFIAPPNDLFVENPNRFAQLLDPARYAQILDAFAQGLSGFGGWAIGIFWILLVYVILQGFERSALPTAIRLWILLGVQLIGYFAIYLITPHDLDWHLRTSLARLLMQVYPLTLLALFASLKPVFNASTGGHHAAHD